MKGVLADYRMGRTIGKGAFSKVKIAYHKETGEKIAIKVVSKKELKASYEKKQKQRAEKAKRKALRENKESLKRESEKGNDEEVITGRKASITPSSDSKTDQSDRDKDKEKDNHRRRDSAGNTNTKTDTNGQQKDEPDNAVKKTNSNSSARGNSKHRHLSDAERQRKAENEAKRKAKEAERQADKDDEMSQHAPGTFSKYLSREARLLQVLDHPNVTRLYQLIETENDYLIVMQYAGGGELVEYMANGGLMEIEARRLFREIISAMDHCHQCGVLHRDLKLENILLSEDIHVRITDFGLGRRYDAGDVENSLSNTFCGTPLYAAPELVSGTRYDGPPADIWAMGVVLFAMMCGAPPFHGERMSQLYRRIKDVEYTMPEEMSDSFKNLISKIFVRDPRKRMTMNEMRVDDWVTDGGALDPPERVPPRVVPDKPIIDCPKSKAEEDDRTASIAFVDNTLVYRFFPTESERKHAADIVNEGGNSEAVASTRRSSVRRMSIKGMSFRNRNRSQTVATTKDKDTSNVGLSVTATSSARSRRSSHAGVVVTLNTQTEQTHVSEHDGPTLPHANKPGTGRVIDISNEAEDESVVPREASANAQDKSQRWSTGSAKDFRVSAQRRDTDTSVKATQSAAQGSASLDYDVDANDAVAKANAMIDAGMNSDPIIKVSETTGTAAGKTSRRKSLSQALSQGILGGRSKSPKAEVGINGGIEDEFALRGGVATPMSNGELSVGGSDRDMQDARSNSLRLEDEVAKIRGDRRNTLGSRKSSASSSMSLAGLKRTFSRKNANGSAKGSKKNSLNSDTGEVGSETDLGSSGKSAFATLRVHRNVIPVMDAPGEEVVSENGRAGRTFSVGGGVDFEAYSSLHIRNNERLSSTVAGKNNHSAAAIMGTYTSNANTRGAGPLAGSSSASEILTRNVVAQTNGSRSVVGGIDTIDKHVASKLNSISVNAAVAAADIAVLPPKARRASMSLVLMNMRRAESNLSKDQGNLVATENGTNAEIRLEQHTKSQSQSHTLDVSAAQTRATRSGSGALKPSQSSRVEATVPEHAANSGVNPLRAGHSNSSNSRSRTGTSDVFDTSHTRAQPRRYSTAGVTQTEKIQATQTWLQNVAQASQAPDSLSKKPSTGSVTGRASRTTSGALRSQAGSNAPSRRPSASSVTAQTTAPQAGRRPSANSLSNKPSNEIRRRPSASSVSSGRPGPEQPGRRPSSGSGPEHVSRRPSANSVSAQPSSDLNRRPSANSVTGKTSSGMARKQSITSADMEKQASARLSRRSTRDSADGKTSVTSPSASLLNSANLDALGKSHNTPETITRADNDEDDFLAPVDGVKASQIMLSLRKESKSILVVNLPEGEKRVKVRSVRGIFRLTNLTGKMTPMEFVAEIERVLTMHGLYYQHVLDNDYLAIRVEYKSQSESVVFDIEVVQVWLLSLVGMRASRRAGSVWLFKQIYAQMKGSLVINA